ncbi:MAG: 4-hydroxyphenylacetate 3-hydroxylase family protein [Dehalococcoidia bacterium]
MVLEQEALGAMTGRRYIESLRDGREIWIDGKRVDDVPTHPAFKDFVHELARIYDLQYSDEYRDQMTFASPDTGNRVSLSWLVPRSREDLKRKRRNSEIWSQQTWGQLGRSPDILAPYITSLAVRRKSLNSVQNPHCDFGDNAVNYTRYCMENDLFLTHALGDPQVDRSEQPQNEQRQLPESEEISLHVVKETPEGVIINGGKQLATAAVVSNETYVSLSMTFMRRNDPRFVLAFSIPTGSPGLKILCREPISRWYGGWGHPFLGLDEQDCMLFFENVLVPWDRLFMLYESTPMVQGAALAGLNSFGYANVCRAQTRMRLFTAVATLIARAIGVYEFREVAAKLGEMATYCAMWDQAIEGMENKAYESEEGEWQLGPGMGMGIWFAQTSSRMAELLKQIAGSGMVMQPSEHDLANPELRPYLDQYMRGKGVDVAYKSRLFRIAHELVASSFGMRQEIYEYWHAGDPNRNRINLLRSYDQGEMIARIEALCAQPLPHGEMG